jgi:hypothetical protein
VPTANARKTDMTPGLMALAYVFVIELHSKTAESFTQNKTAVEILQISVQGPSPNGKKARVSPAWHLVSSSGALPTVARR